MTEKKKETATRRDDGGLVFSCIVIYLDIPRAILLSRLRMPITERCISGGSSASILATYGSNWRALYCAPLSAVPEVCGVRKPARVNNSSSLKPSGLAILRRIRADGKRSPLSIRPRCEEDTPDSAASSCKVRGTVILCCLRILPKSELL